MVVSVKKKILSWKNNRAKTEYLESLRSNVKKDAISYDKDQNYSVGDYITHFKFGFGFIQKVICPTKMEVFFENSEKVLLQNWQQK